MIFANAKVIIIIGFTVEDIGVSVESTNLVLHFNYKMKIRTTFIILFLLTALMITSCRSRRGTRQQRQAFNTEEQMQKDSEKASEDLREYHYDKQADKTKEMMKETKKRNKKLKKSKREPFFKRLFGGNRSKGCN